MDCRAVMRLATASTGRGSRGSLAAAFLAVAALTALTWGGVSCSPAPRQGPGGEERPNRAVILATTTSVHDSGLLDVLIPQFERASGYRVKTIAVGTGQALALAARGEVDAVLVHAPAAEEAAVAAGIVVDRRPVMHNDFVIVGPPSDPAGIRGLKSAPEALARVFAARGRGARFVSRGDDSGTHQKERELWALAGLGGDPPSPGSAAPGADEGAGSASWYQETGQGMGQTLIISWEKQAYTLADRATYLTLKPRLDLGVMVEGDPRLANPYHIMRVNPVRFDRVNAAGSRALVEWLTSAPAQEAIGRFGLEQHGQPLFEPEEGAEGP
ncbi:MAG: substrate-binding domain-containing protein [Acetobacteraceae bacterium]|nr:substrate-binding domain-containing protein [Acetobacteraceae bacterium]